MAAWKWWERHYLSHLRKPVYFLIAHARKIVEGTERWCWKKTKTFFITLTLCICSVYIYIYLSRKFVHGLCTSIRLECIMWIPHVIFAVWACCLRPCGFKLWHYGVWAFLLICVQGWRRWSEDAVGYIMLKELHACIYLCLSLSIYIHIYIYLSLCLSGWCQLAWIQR